MILVFNIFKRILYTEIMLIIHIFSLKKLVKYTDADQISFLKKIDERRVIINSFYDLLRGFYKIDITVLHHLFKNSDIICGQIIL